MPLLSSIFDVNPELGVRPTISVIEDPTNPNAEFKDVLVQVKETHTGSIMIGGSCAALAKDTRVREAYLGRVAARAE